MTPMTLTDSQAHHFLFPALHKHTDMEVSLISPNTRNIEYKL